MRPISAKVVEATWKRMASISPLQSQQIVDGMSKRQPVVLAYLMGAGGDLLNEDERGLLLYLGVVVWQMMLQGDAPLLKVTEKILDRAEERNMKMLERFAGEPFDLMEKGIEGMLRNYHQREVLEYVVEALMEEPEEGCFIRDENRGIMMVFLKTVIDCFDWAGTA
ncbi:MAG TPA: hypothetical protein EYP63_07065, partial [Desulfotomaculum sp.]|nr:hypothetical protein [Desulfotomaculum sp.]